MVSPLDTKHRIPRSLHTPTQKPISEPFLKSSPVVVPILHPIPVCRYMKLHQTSGPHMTPDHEPLLKNGETVNQALGFRGLGFRVP